MKKLTNTNHNPPDGYELFMNVTDWMGRKWKFLAAPTHGGSYSYFHTLPEYIHWCEQVEDIRNMADGKLSINERIHNAMVTGDMSVEVARRIIARHTLQAQQ